MSDRAPAAPGTGTRALGVGRRLAAGCPIWHAHPMAVPFATFGARAAALIPVAAHPLASAKDLPGVKWLGLIMGLLFIYAAIRAMFGRKK